LDRRCLEAGLVAGTLDAIEPLLATAAEEEPTGLFTELHALALLRSGRPDDARRRLGPWTQRDDVPEDFLWLTRMAIRAALWSELAPPDMVRALHARLAPYATKSRSPAPASACSATSDTASACWPARPETTMPP